MEGSRTYMECKRILATTCKYTIFFQSCINKDKVLKRPWEIYTKRGI